MANNIDLTICAPKPSFRRFRCSAWLIQLRQRTALSPLKRSCFRFASLPSDAAPNQLFELLRCSAWLIHDFAPSPMRALVFRSAYSASRNARASAAFAASIKAHCAVSSETLMLQVRSAHPPMPHRTSPSSCAYSASRNARTPAASRSSWEPHCTFSSKTLMLQVRSAHPPNPSRPAAAPINCTCQNRVSPPQGVSGARGE